MRKIPGFLLSYRESIAKLMFRSVLQSPVKQAIRVFVYEVSRIRERKDNETITKRTSFPQGSRNKDLMILNLRMAAEAGQEGDLDLPAQGVCATVKVGACVYGVHNARASYRAIAVAMAFGAGVLFMGEVDS